MTSVTGEAITPPTELELDNATRLAIFDAVSKARDAGKAAVTMDELFDLVITPLRPLVPRELFTLGERPYVEAKVAICVQAGVLKRTSDGRYAVAPHPQVWIRYPDDSIRPYTPGLMAARERLNAVNKVLRDRNFDVTKHLPHHNKPTSAEFKALVRSIEEHGFLKQFAIYRFADGTYVDGVARIAAAKKAGVEPKWLELKKQDPETTRMRRRDTPLNRVLLALDANATRLTDDERQHALDAAAAATGRSWEEIDTALRLTRAWRAAIARSYTPTFQVREIAFDDGARKIQVTADHKVHVTSLLRASGLAKHKFDTELKDIVPFEMARVKGGGPAAVFVHAAEMVDGLETMLSERRARGRKVSAEWEVTLEWLRKYVHEHGVSRNGAGG